MPPKEDNKVKALFCALENGSNLKRLIAKEKPRSINSLEENMKLQVSTHTRANSFGYRFSAHINCNKYIL